MNRRDIVVLILATILAGSGLWLYFKRPSKPQRSALFLREAATRVLGDYLAERFPGKKALIISNPYTQASGRPPQIYQFEAAGVAGLQSGFGEKITSKVVFPDLQPEAQENPASVYVDPQTTTPLSYLVAIGSFDRLLRGHPDHQLAVSLIGLPLNFFKQWVPQKQTASFALLLPDWKLIGNSEMILQLFKSGTIVAAVMKKPNAGLEAGALSSDYREAFKDQFLLVTPDNCADLVNQYRRLF